MKILAGSMLAMTLAAGAVQAQETVDLSSASNLIRGDVLEDGNIYSVEAGIEQAEFEGATFTRIETAWDDVGDIDDLVLDTSGQLVAVVAEIGGFMGLGDRDVLLPIADVAIVKGENGEVAYVTRLSQEELSQLPEVQEGFWD